MNIKKMLNISMCMIMLIFLFGCGKKEDVNETAEKKDEEITVSDDIEDTLENDNDCIEMSVEELHYLTKHVKESKEYDGKKIKVYGYYLLDGELDSTHFKYITDGPFEYNYKVQFYDGGIIGEQYQGENELELTLKVHVGTENIFFYVTDAIVDERYGESDSNQEKNVIEAYSVSTFLKNREYFRGAELTVYGKLGYTKDKDAPLINYYLEDIKTGERYEYDRGLATDRVVDYARYSENPYVVATINEVEDYFESDTPLIDDTLYITYSIKSYNVIDSIKVVEKKKFKKKDYSTVLTVKELIENYDKYKDKLVTLKGYGCPSDYYDVHDSSPVSYFLADEGRKHDIRVFTKERTEEDPRTDVYYSFSSSHLYTVKGYPRIHENGYKYFEVDSN